MKYLLILATLVPLVGCGSRAVSSYEQITEQPDASSALLDGGFVDKLQCQKGYSYTGVVVQCDSVPSAVVTIAMVTYAVDDAGECVATQTPNAGTITYPPADWVGKTYCDWRDDMLLVDSYTPDPNDTARCLQIRGTLCRDTDEPHNFPEN